MNKSATLSNIYGLEAIISAFEALPFKDEPCDFTSENYNEFNSLVILYNGYDSNSLSDMTEFMEYYEKYKDYFTLIYQRALSHIEKTESFCNLGVVLQDQPTYTALFNAAKEPKFYRLVYELRTQCVNFKNAVYTLTEYQTVGFPPNVI
jgi:lantibiotic modifying enzyme